MSLGFAKTHGRHLWYVFLLSLIGCNAGYFDSSVGSTSAHDSDATVSTDIIAEGMDYEGDPIVLKDPPPDNYALLTDIASEWQTKVVTTAQGSHELNGTSRQSNIQIARLQAARQNVQSVSQVSRQSYTEVFAQRGQTSSTATETFTQANRGLLDILLVIDNSGLDG